MPFVYPADVVEPSHTLHARAESSSEAAALPNGEKALTPIIAGSISGACVGAAWIIALIVAIVKRWRRHQRYKRVGKPKERPPPGVYIVPPDPAVLQGRRQPGERIELEKEPRWWEASRWTHKLGKDKGKGKLEGKCEEEDNQVGFREKDNNVAVEPPQNSEADEDVEVSTSKYPSRVPHITRLSTIMSVNSDGSQSRGGQSNGLLNQSNSYDGRKQAELRQTTANLHVVDGSGSTEENVSGRSDAGYGLTEESYTVNSERPLHRYPPSA